MRAVIDREDLEYIAEYIPELWGKLASSSLQMEQKMFEVSKRLKWALDGYCEVTIESKEARR
jgi:hypothetical protein